MQLEVGDPAKAQAPKMLLRCGSTGGHEGGGNPQWSATVKGSCPSCGSDAHVEIIGWAEKGDEA